MKSDRTCFIASDCCQTIYFLLKQRNMEGSGALPGLQPPSGHIHLLLTVYTSSLGAWQPHEVTEGSRSFQGVACSQGVDWPAAGVTTQSAA